MRKVCFYIFCLFAGLSVISGNLSAQECGADELHQRMLQFSEVYRADIAAYERLSKENHEDEHSHLKMNNCGVLNRVNTIPVVVHVIYLGENIGTGSNISDQQIISAINAANDRFRNSSGQSLDVDVQLVLAKTDPNGQPTSGINRVNGSHIASYASRGIIMEGEAGSNAIEVKSLSIWPRDKYYNIWVLHKIDGGWSGFAQFPTTYRYEGTHMDYRYMTAAGVTLTHEVGHALNLQHTFNGDNDGNSCPGNAVCQIQGDFVCDTPPHKKGDCGTTATCNDNSGYPFTNSSRNIMSYCSSRLLFTPQQRQRMSDALKIYNRSSLLNSPGLVSAVANTDLSLVSMAVAQNEECSGRSFKINLTNTGVVPVSNVLFRLKTDQDIFTFTYSGNLLSGESTEWTSPELNISAGRYNVLLEIYNVNGLPGDDRADNNFLCGQYNFLSDAVENQCYRFEDNTLPEGMIITKNGTVNTYIHDVSGCADQGAKALAYNQWNVVPGSDYSDEIKMPAFTLDNADGAVLIYDRSYAKMNTAANYSTLHIQVSEDCGETFTTLTSLNGDALATTTRIIPSSKYTPRNCSEWKRDTVDLSGHTSMHNIVRFQVQKISGQKDQNIYLDNICIAKKFLVEVSSDPEKGTAGGSGLYIDGQSATLSATPLDGYIFEGWYENGELISSLPVYTFEVKSRRQIDAVFYSIPTSVKHTENLSARIYPNPGKDHVYLDIRTSKSFDIQVQIRDLKGQLLRTVSLQKINGSATIPLSLERLSSGLYLVELHSLEGTANYKLMVLE